MKWKLIKLGATFLIASLSLSGCVNTKSSDKSSKRATIMEQADISSLDPSMITDVGALETVNNSQEGLYRMKSSTQIEPGLAKKIVKPTRNGTLYTFHLRKNLRWSNGDKLTAKDFVAGWERTVDPKTKASQAYLYLPIKNATAIEKGKISPRKLGIKAINKDTFQVKLTKATPYFNYLCASVPFLPQNPRAIKRFGKLYGTSSKRMVYSGPFIIKNWNASSNNWVLKRNSNYWDRKNVRLQRIKFETVKDPQTALSLYQSGKLDNIILAGQQAAQEKKNKDYVSYPSGEIDYVAYNFHTKVLKNKFIRKAISLTINRQSLVNNVLKNGAKAPTGIVPTEIAKNPRNGKDFAKDAKVTNSVSYNPELAKKYWKRGLAQLRVKKMVLSMVCYDVDSFKNSAEFIQSSAEKYLKGLTINIHVEPKVQAITTMQNKRGYDLGFSNWITSYPDLDQFFQLLNSGNANNAGNYSNKAYDYYYHRANGIDSLNPQKRYNDFKQAQYIAMNDQAILSVNQGQMVRLNNPRLKNVSYVAAAGISLKAAYKVNK